MLKFGSNKISKKDFFNENYLNKKFLEYENFLFKDE